MNLNYHTLAYSICAIMATGAILSPSAARAQTSNVEDVQVLTRGPVHEAFAESVSFDPKPGLIVRIAPPAMIEELPPEQQLEGDNVTWIPGYWAWDDDQNDFIWISGIWRNLPPGRQWVPGYWSEIEGGQCQWTSGYWADAAVEEVSYISTAPPRSIDSGPNIAAPADNYNWFPGYWNWVDARYVWRPGYWGPLYPNWTWVPSRYCWTHRGYVYVDGYWDHAVASRGVLFAPVYFNRHVYADPYYYYTPSIVVGLSVFSDHLFYHPHHCHYYFGDYYATRYRDAGFHASFVWHSGHRGYDPIYAYDRWHHRGDRHWETRRLSDLRYFRENEDARPPRTWAAMNNFRGERFNDGRNRSFASTLDSYAKRPVDGQRFRTLDKDRRTQMVSQRQEMRNFSQQRRNLESKGIASGDSSRKTASRERIARSPITGRQVDRLAKNEAPPKRIDARTSDVRVKPGAQKSQDSGITRNDPTRRSQTRPEGKTQMTPQRRESSNPRVGQAPQRKSQVTPQRQSQPQSQIRKAPERRQQAAPQRQSQPQPQIRNAPERRQQAAPQRQSQPQAQARKVPERKPQAEPQRQSQPKQQVRETPPRKSQTASQSAAGSNTKKDPSRAEEERDKTKQ